MHIPCVQMAIFKNLRKFAQGLSRLWFKLEHRKYSLTFKIAKNAYNDMILVSSDLEKSFLEGLLHHDEAIMRAFYSTYYRYLAATVMLYVPRQQDMQDVLQDIFIKIFTKINRFTYKGHGSLQAWIHKIAVNESLKFVQSRKRRFHYPIDQYDKEEDGENDPEQFTIDDIPQQVLLEMIRTLPERYRLVFNLFVFEEKSHKEIGVLLKIKESTSASNLHRARALLCNKIVEYRKTSDHEK